MIEPIFSAIGDSIDRIRQSVRNELSDMVKYTREAFVSNFVPVIYRVIFLIVGTIFVASGLGEWFQGISKISGTSGIITGLILLAIGYLVQKK